MKLDLVYPDVRVRLARVYADILRLYKYKMRACQGTRTFVEQAYLFSKGRTAPGKIVTHAEPGESFHNYGCAVDSCFSGLDPFLDKDPDGNFLWTEFGRFCKLYGLTWGGTFRMLDMPHAELTYGLKLREIQLIYKAGKIPGVWTKFDQIRGVEPGDGWEQLRPQLLLI